VRETCFRTYLDIRTIKRTNVTLTVTGPRESRELAGARRRRGASGSGRIIWSEGVWAFRGVSFRFVSRATAPAIPGLGDELTEGFF
jgi:hypothetical protein